MTKKKNHLQWKLLILLLCISGILALNIRVNDNALDLLPGDAVRGDLTILQKLGLVNRVILTLSLDKELTTETSVEELKKATKAIGARLENSDHFTNVVYQIPEKATFQTYDILRRNLPLLLSKKDLQQLANRTGEEGIAEAMDTIFSALNSPAGYGMKHQIQHDPLGFTPFFLKKLKHLKAQYAISIEDGLFLSSNRRDALIIAESKLQLTDANSASSLDFILSEIFREELAAGITPRVIGSLPHTLANAQSIQHDLKTLLPIATLLLLLLLLISLRSLRGVLVLAIPFLAAPTAIVCTALIYSKISALALGFGIVLLGIAVDFSIHLYCGLARAGSEQRHHFLKKIRKPILLATATTASVFVVVLFSDVPSHRQMATLALSGILLAVCYSWVFVPLIVPSAKHDTVQLTSSKSLLHIPAAPRLFLLFIWLSVIIAGFFSWSNLRYNGNLQTLDAPNKRVIADEKHFTSVWGETGEQAFIVSHGSKLDEALQYNYHVYTFLEKHPNASYQTVAPLLPSLKDQRENLTNWLQFWEKKDQFMDLFKSKARQTGFAEGAFAPFFTSLQSSPLPTSLLKELPTTMHMLVNSMIRHHVPIDGEKGNREFLITTTVTVDETLYSKLLKLDNDTPGITFLANKKWRGEVEKLLRRDMVRLSTSAALIITIITCLFFRSLLVSLAVLAPVLSALSTMALFCALTGSELNMMHLLMGIMVIGLAVDYGIFTACNVMGKEEHHSQKAISICAMSSLIGFGVLSFAQHPALQSLGITVLVGIGAAWPTAIFISPLFLAEKKDGAP